METQITRIDAKGGKQFIRVLAPVLALSMCVSLTGAAFAFQLPIADEPAVEGATEMALEEIEGYILSMQGKDLSSGDARFSMIVNRRVVSESYVNRSESAITSTQYKNNHIVSQEVKNFVSATQVSPYATAGFTYVGRVGYNHYIQEMNSGVNYIRLEL